MGEGVLAGRYEPVLFIILSALAISTMVNAPGILVGYGLVFAVEYYVLLAYSPGRGTLYFLAAHLLALPILLSTKSIFLTVAVASILLRTPALYTLGRLGRRLGPLGLALGLAALEQILALTTAIAYYGDDGIHTGLSIYGVLLAPFTYMIYKFTRLQPDPTAAIAAVASLLGYWLSLYAFPVPTLLAGALAGLALLVLSGRIGVRLAAVAAVALVLAGAGLGGVALQYNAKVAFYPFNPHSWSSDRWAQAPGTQCPYTGNVFENTHSPARLRIIEQCVTVEGVVKPVPHISGDGDYCFDIKVTNNSLLGIGNLVLRRGGLHVEVVPGDHYKVLDPIGGGVCPGDRVRVTGVFVVDTDHGMWSEIHPAYKIEVIERGSSKEWPDCIRGVEYEGG
ncbi:MAG: hypothetical protein GSR73_04690 [Desulfurococcales archaeon]|nr:hypothetical protein [Desulfurococcales archaeon]